MVACCPGSLAGLVDLLFDVLDGGVLGDTGLGLLVGHLSSCRGEVLVTLKKTQPVSPATDLDCPLVIGCSKRRNSIFKSSKQKDKKVVLNFISSFISCQAYLCISGNRTEITSI